MFKNEINFAVSHPTMCDFSEDYTGFTMHCSFVQIKYRTELPVGVFADIRIYINKYGDVKEIKRTVEIDFMDEDFAFHIAAYDILKMLKEEDPDYLYCYSLDNTVELIKKHIKIENI